MRGKFRMASLLLVVTAAGVAFARPQQKSAAAPEAKTVTPDQLQWKPGILPGMEVAALEGDMSQKGTLTVRMRFPDGFRLAPHTHPHPERVTLLSGTWLSARGTSYDASALRPLPAGSFMVTVPGVYHYGQARGEVVMQITTEGPYDFRFLDPNDDPRREKKR